MNRPDNRILILGGGLTGLTAGSILSRSGMEVSVLERDRAVGGIAKTIEHRGFRFDLGGHRFHTTDERIKNFVRDLMGDELIRVTRSSKIFMRGKYFDYPLTPLNALFGMGIPETMRILADYGKERLKRLLRSPEPVSLEDWVVAQFGRTMYDIYFKEYSEKVWGIDCRNISAEWVSQRIKGLSLSKAVASAFIRPPRGSVATLVDEFLYPRLGIGRIAERLRETIEQTGSVLTDTRVERIRHADNRITEVAEAGAAQRRFPAGAFISSMPLTTLIGMLDPPPPAEVLAAAAALSYRDLIIAAVMINRARATDQTWIYLPEQRIPFGRIHEPTNWSERMAPRGTTLLVAEYFCFRGDARWNETDAGLTDLTIQHLEQLGYIRRAEVLDSVVVRVPGAYPLFEVGYQRHVAVLMDYCARFRNLYTAGRGGMFKYLNMDHAIGSGMQTAERILALMRPGAMHREAMAP